MEPNLKKGIGEETDNTDNIFPTKILALNNTTPVCVCERETERGRGEERQKRKQIHIQRENHSLVVFDTNGVHSACGNF